MTRSTSTTPATAATRATTRGAPGAGVDTHEIEISMVPPAPEERPELRDGNLGDALVKAIETIRATLAAAADGEDPFVLDESKITIVFGVTSEGDISIGVNGSLNDELTQTLTLSLVPA